MNGNAINQVLLNLPQSGSASVKNAVANTSANNASVTDFAQAFQDLHKSQVDAQAKAKQATTDSAAARNQQRNAATARDSAVRESAARDSAARNSATRDAAVERNRAADKRQQASERKDADVGAHPAAEKSVVKHAPKHTEASKRKAASETDEPSAQNTEQAADARPTPVAQDSQNTDCQSDAEATQTADDATAIAATSELAPASETAVAADQLLQLAQGNTIQSGTTVAGEATVAGQVPAATSEAALDPTSTLADIAGDLAGQGDTDTTGVAGEQGEGSSDELVADTALAATLPTTAEGQSTTDSSVDVLNSALVAQAAVPGTVPAAATAQTEIPGEAASQAATLVKSEGSINNATASTGDDLLADASTDTADSDLGLNSSGFDKGGFDKMLKSMMPTSQADAGSRELPLAPAGQSSSAAPALDFARPQDAQGASALRSFVVQTSVPVPVGQPQWSQAVGDKVLWLAAQNISAAEINLHPLDMGPIQVKVTVNQDQANVAFTSHHPAVREVLDQNLNRLRDMFSEQGMNLVNVDVSDRSFQRQQGEGKDQQGQSNSAGKEAEEEAVAAVSVIKAQRLVDHYA